MIDDDRARTLDLVGRRLVLRRATLAEIIGRRHAELRPGLPRASAEFAGDDEPATWHFGAFVAEHAGAGGGALACATFMARPHDGEDAYQLRGMATRADLARQGIGGALLRHALAVLVARGGARLFWCNARLAAVPFYARLGWTVVSGEFEVPSIGPHHVMTFRAVPGEQ